MAYNPNNPNGQATSANSEPVVIASDQSAIPVSASSLPLPAGASTEATLALIKAKTDNIDVLLSTRTKPADTQIVSGTVTANAGTNLNTSSLATSSTQTDRTQKSQVTDGTRDGTIKAASTSAIAADTSLVVALSPNTPLPAGTAVIGHVIADAGSTTAVTGNVTAVQATASNLKTAATLDAETTKVIGTVNVAAGQTIAVTQATAANLNATVVGTGAFVTQSTLAAETTKVIGTINVAAAQTIATTNAGTFATQESGNQLVVDNAGFTDGTNKVLLGGYILDEVAGTALTENDAAAARIDSKRAVVHVIEDATTRGQRASVSAAGAIKVDGSAATQPVSGTVTATQATAANLNAAVVGTGTAGAPAGNILTVQGVASMTKLLVTPDSVALPANQSVNVAQVGGTNTVTGGVAGIMAVGGNVANAVAATANPVPVGGIFTTVPATLTTGQTATAQFTAAQNLKHDITTIAGTAPTTVGKLDVKAADGDAFVRQATASNLNATVVGTGTFVTQSTLAAETTKVIGTARLLGNVGATLDSTVGAGTAPTNMLATGGLYNNTPPTPTAGQSLATQLDQAGNQRVFNGIASAVLSVWNSGTALNTTQTIFTNSGAASAIVHLVQSSGTFTAGAITFEVSYDGTNWITAPANTIIDPTLGFGQISIPYTLITSTNKAFLVELNGAQGLRMKLSTAITGTGTVTPNYNLLGFSPVQANSPVIKGTYRASTIIPLVAAVTVNVPFFNIIGSATKTVTVKRITVSGMTLTAVGYFTINAEKLSTASTGGTSTTLVATTLDTGNAAVSAVVKAYTAAPTKGSLVGTLRSWRALWQATVAAAGGVTDYYDFSFSDINGSGGVVLRGIAQELALTFPVVLASAGTLSVDIEWTEEG